MSSSVARNMNRSNNTLADREILADGKRIIGSFDKLSIILTNDNFHVRVALF
jgi:hypothetical protein